jgi:oxygen-independent coproporphyrinogen-3 oxidase
MIEHIYIHVPFCLQKCSYCSFYSEIFHTASKDKYLNLLKKEAQLFLEKYAIDAKTIYFGGGTPSLLQPEELQSIIDLFPGKKTEITLEVNPASVDRKYISQLAQTQVNRISLGAQSFLDKELKLLGRLHDSADIYQIYEEFRKAEFCNISLDLIYGLPNQRLVELKHSLQELKVLQPEHVSLYCLSLEEDVPLHEARNEIPTDATVANFYHKIREFLQNCGYQHYEISNFCQPGRFSQHNSCYWQDKHYIGVGPAAAGYVGKFRYRNAADLQAYSQQIEAEIIEENKEYIDEQRHKQEYIMLALRTESGIDLQNYFQKFAVDFEQEYFNILNKYEKYFNFSDNKISLKSEYYFVSNQILAEF